MKFRFIEAEKVHFPITVMCRVLRVSRAGFYAWLRRPKSVRATTNGQVLERIQEIHSTSTALEAYGSPRLCVELRAEGVFVSRNRIARLMRRHGLRARQRRRFKSTTKSDHRFAVAENLLDRKFEATEPNTAWVADVTYIRTLQGWVYLAIVVDLFSRAVVGWAMDERIGGALPAKALRMAIDQRRPGPGLIHHSDRGTEYACDAFQQLLAEHGIVCSMSRSGNCWDNAVAESFFASLKLDLDPDRVYVTRAEAQRDVFRYIETFYNRLRRHSSLGHIAPAAFEAAKLAA